MVKYKYFMVGDRWWVHTFVNGVLYYSMPVEYHKESNQ